MLTDRLHIIRYKGALELFLHGTLVFPLQSHCWIQYG